ncbi:GTP cyclohydrolase 1 type 2/Nif3 [Cristinia sonorae]|uniref:ATP phosphoribosyltransferase n=1 Tax=Cristinia sonorae TaxID=1940300 RepID=A0A8K0UKE7_9AGAR|nr:GTP cyclohydrolase 1 type 2/Nif3 [Cristinia sonorae]
MPRFKLVFFAPVKTTSTILNHIFAKHPNHVGKIGEYDQCAFMTQGTGQFRPTANAKPAIGSKEQLEYVEEHRVEVLVYDEGDNEQIKAAVAELKKVHPYEEVAYDVYRLKDF